MFLNFSITECCGIHCKKQGSQNRALWHTKTRGWGSERESKTWTDWFILVMYEQDQLWTQLESDDNSSDSCWWSMVSKAADQSRRTTPVGLFWDKLSLTSLVIFSRALLNGQCSNLTGWCYLTHKQQGDTWAALLPHVRFERQ